MFAGEDFTRTTAARSFALIVALSTLFPRFSCIGQDGERLPLCSTAVQSVLLGFCGGQRAEDCSCSCCSSNDFGDNSSKPACPYSGKPCQLAADQPDASTLVKIFNDVQTASLSAPMGEAPEVLLLAPQFANLDEIDSRRLVPLDLVSLGQMLRV